MDATLETLLAQASFVRGMARSLGGREGDDLEQETWLSVLKRPPEDGAPRPWLGEVMRNARRMAFRGDARRIAREHAFEQAQHAKSPAELVEALELNRILVEAVLALGDPYRETLLLRYWRELSSAAIGARLHVPAGTVRSHLKTALERVRDTLDRRYGARATWQRALVGSPLFHLATAVEGALVWKLAVAAVAVALLWTAHARHTRLSPVPPAPVAAHFVAPASSTVASRHADIAHIKAVHHELLAVIRARRPAAENTLSPAMTRSGTLDASYIQEALQEVTPLMKDCFEAALPAHPDLHGTVVLRFTISGDPDLAGMVADSAVVEDETNIDDKGLRECMQESMYAARFDPPEHGGDVVVTYPFTLADAPTPK